MGLKEEMLKDVGDVARPVVAVKKTDGKVEHVHTAGFVEIATYDGDGSRRMHQVPGRKPFYVFNCKACVAEDKARREALPTIPDEDLENTVFLIPERDHDSALARLYLSKRYPAEIVALSDIRPERMASWPRSQIVVITRRMLPGARALGGKSELRENKKDEMVEVPIPIEFHLPEIFESAPVLVSDCVTANAATMFADSVTDITELRTRLAELCSPCFTIAQYQRVVGSNERVFSMRAL